MFSRFGLDHIKGARHTADGSGLTIIIPDMKETTGVEKDISPSPSPCEWILLESLDCHENRPLHAGPFLTVQRRRRRRKYVRTYLFKDPTLIDDLSAYQTNFVLDRISKWAFNAFILDNVTGGRPLPNLCVHLFKSYGLLEHFNLDPVIVWKLFSIIEDGYHWRNPYHNAIHAADVTQAMHCFLQESLILEKLEPLEIFAAIVAAVTHDLDHPGVNQPFLVATSNHLVALYKNSSVLENHHWRSAMGCLNESGVSDVLGRDKVAEVEEQIKSLVLATDITRQQEFLTRLKTYIDTETLDMSDPDVRHFVLQIALKCADICNPCRPWDISRKWSMKVCEEFFRQGDYERQLNLPVTPVCDRYSTSVPKIQTGFLKFVVRPLFEEWHRMMNTPLSTVMIENLNKNDVKWNQLFEAEHIQDALNEEMEAEETELIKKMIIENPDLVNSKPPVPRSREPSESDREGRSVRFEPTIITASDSDENSEGEDTMYIPKLREHRTSEFLNIPRPDARRHSIATGLMGDNMQIPAQLLQMSAGLNSNSGSLLSISDMVSGETSTGRLIGRTTIRRESLPAGPGARGTLSSKTILHLQKISSSRHGSEAGLTSPGFGLTSPLSSSDLGDIISGDTIPASPSRILGEKSSCSSASTTDEILDFTFSLPEPGPSRSSGSPRRLTETTDFDELCPGTSILSMSNRVAHITLQQGADLEDQRRHLIRQQTCPVVSVNSDGSFNRPRFLSAAAAISPTAVASSSIISQHKMRNKSPESGGEGDGQGLLSSARGSRGSSNEALKCEVISEEADRQSGSESSAEASPLEIFVQQFPPSDDNDGEAPRRGSGSLDPSDVLSVALSQNSNNNRSTGSLNIDPSTYSSPDGISDFRPLPFDGSTSLSDECHGPKGQAPPPPRPFLTSGKSNSSVSCQSGFGGEESEIEVRRTNEKSMFETCLYPSQSHDELNETLRTQRVEEKVDREATGERNSMKPNTVNKTRGSSSFPSQSHNLTQFRFHPPTPTVSISTQTDWSCEKENVDPSNIPISDLTGSLVSTSQLPSTSSSSGSVGAPPGTSSSNASRLATILMWRNNRLWKSLTEEHEENPTSLDLDPDENHHRQLQLPDYYERWDVRVSQQNHQGIVGGRLQMRRGSAPTAAPALGSRGGLDRRSDPTQYHSSSCVSSSFNFGSLFGSLPLSETPSSLTGFGYGLVNASKQQQLRRVSAPVEMLRQSTLRANLASTKKQPLPRMGRRGSLPTDPSASSESSYAYKWMHVFPYNEDDGLGAMKRRSSGGPELFAAAETKTPSTSTIGGWKAQILIDQFNSSVEVPSCSSTIWPAVRRGSLPVDVYIGGSCSSESESSGKISSKPTLKCPSVPVSSPLGHLPMLFSKSFEV